jgi:hypothetical protein
MNEVLAKLIKNRGDGSQLLGAIGVALLVTAILAVLLLRPARSGPIAQTPPPSRPKLLDEPYKRTALPTASETAEPAASAR